MATTNDNKMYTKCYADGWKNSDGGGTPITADTLNKIENHLRDVYNAVVTIDTNTEGAAETSKYHNRKNNIRRFNKIIL